MTIIASFRAHGVPFLLGDLLLTGVQQPSSVVSLPTLGEVTDFFGDTGWGVVGLRQKTVLISDNCAIAWAGSMLGARVAIEDLRRVAAQERLTAVRAREFLNAHPDASHLGTSFVGLVLEPGSSILFSVRAEQAQLHSLGAAFVAGTGAETFQKVTTMQALTETSTGSGNASQLDRAYVIVQRYIAFLLRMELNAGYSAATIRECFGGGYELVFPVRDKLVKLPELTTVIWSAVIEPDNFRLGWELVVKQRYERDFLIVKSVRPITGGADRCVDIISPMYTTDYKVDPLDFVQMNLDSERISHLVILRDGANSHMYTRFDRQLPGSETVKIEEDEHGLTVAFHPRFAEEIYAGLLQQRSPGHTAG